MKPTLTFSLQASQIMRQLGFVLTSILLAKSGLPISDIGVVETLFFIGTTLSYFWLNGLLQSLLAFMPTVNAADKRDVYGAIALIFVALSIFLFLFIKTCPTLILTTLTTATTLPYLDIFALYLLLNSAPFFLEGYWAVEKDPLSILIFSGISNLIMPFAIVVPLWFGGALDQSFYGLLGIALVRFIWLLLILIKNKSVAITHPHIKRFIQLSVPIMAYSLLNGVTMTFSFWLVSNYLAGNTAEFAVFRFGAREFPLVMALTTGLSNAFVPIVSEAVNSFKIEGSTSDIKNFKAQIDKNTEGVLYTLKKKTERLWHILFPSSIVLMLVAKPLFPLVFNTEFARSADIFTIFLLLLISRALFPQTILLALNQTKTLLFASILETISIIALGFVGIYALGTEGVAWALVLGFLLEKIIIIWLLKRRYTIDFQYYTNRPLYFMYSIALLISYYVQHRF